MPHPLPHPRRSGLSVSVLKQTYLLLIKRTFFLFPRYFGVFDGHGGSKVAAYAANNLHRFIVKREEYKENREEAIKEGFLECDRTMKTVDSLKDEMAGCTAITVFIRGKELWCANAGDSRCVAGVGGVARPLSTDHKPMVSRTSTSSRS